MSKVTRSTFDRQYEHIANVRHGVATGPWRVEFPAMVKADANAAKIFQGSIVSLNADGQYVPGCPAGTATNCPVPFVSMKNVFDPDVTTGYNDGDNWNKRSTFSAQGGKITAIPSTAGYEMETTEFDTEATYAPNDALVAGTGDNLGKVVKATAGIGAESVLGFVSVPPRKDEHGNTRLAFFAAFVPAAAEGSDSAANGGN